MPQLKPDHKQCKKTQKITSISEPKPRMSNHRHASESRITCSSKTSNKKRFLLVKLRGLGCRGAATPAVSTPAIIRSAAQWEAAAKDGRNHMVQKKKRKAGSNSNNRRNNPAKNVAVDVPDVCCTPPGIGIASDFAAITRKPAPRVDHRKATREARRKEDESGPDFAAVLSTNVGYTTNHRSAQEIIEMLMSRQTVLPGRIIQGNDEHQHWGLNVDDMSYEELLDLSDKIGYVGSGLQEEEIYKCLKKFKNYDFDSPSLFVRGHKDLKCSICQETCRRDDDIGTLGCGHHHHLECIKQWLRHKNACPVCKSAAVRHRSK